MFYNFRKTDIYLSKNIHKGRDFCHYFKSISNLKLEMASIIKKGIGILRAPKTSLFLCDMQEKFKPNIKFFDEVVANSSRILKAASVMDIPVLATEQYPKGLGPTVPELGLAEANIKAYPKTCFSMVIPELMEELRGNY